MKLYGKMRSERAMKGQGGNNFLEIELCVGSAQASEQFAIVRLEREQGKTPDSFRLTVVSDNYVTVLNAKGEKQKGENVGECYMDVFNKKCLTYNHKH